jgi:hypothetical protein
MRRQLATAALPGPPSLDATRFGGANREKLSAPGLQALLGIADLWGLTEQQRLLTLGLPPRSTYYSWVKAAQAGGRLTLPVDTLLRISAVLGIHKALRILFATDAEGVAWLRGPNAALPFAGQPPLALVTAGTQDGLMAVRRFLDAARGGLFLPPTEADRDAAPLTDADILFA